MATLSPRYSGTGTTSFWTLPTTDATRLSGADVSYEFIRLRSRTGGSTGNIVEFRFFLFFFIFVVVVVVVLLFLCVCCCCFLCVFFGGGLFILFIFFVYYKMYMKVMVSLKPYERCACNRLLHHFHLPLKI